MTPLSHCHPRPRRQRGWHRYPGSLRPSPRLLRSGFHSPPLFIFHVTQYVFDYINGKYKVCRCSFVLFDHKHHFVQL